MTDEADTLRRTVVELIWQGVKFGFVAGVAYAAVSGDVWGRWFAILVALRYLQTIAGSLGKLEHATKS